MKAIILAVLTIFSVQVFAADTVTTKQISIRQEDLICTIGLMSPTDSSAQPQDQPQAIVTVKSLSSKPENANQIDYLVSLQPVDCKTVREIQATAWHNFGMLMATLTVTESDVLPGFSHSCYKNVYATLTIKPRDANIKELPLAMGTSFSVACPTPQ